MLHQSRIRMVLTDKFPVNVHKFPDNGFGGMSAEALFAVGDEALRRRQRLPNPLGHHERVVGGNEAMRMGCGEQRENATHVRCHHRHTEDLRLAEAVRAVVDVRRMDVDRAGKKGVAKLFRRRDTLRDHANVRRPNPRLSFGEPEIVDAKDLPREIIQPGFF